MSSAALLSCLGVEGWGPCHLLLPCRGEPEALLQRLRQAWQQARLAGAEQPRATHLLASLLREQQDLRPVIAPWDAALPFRHRLRCLRGEGLPRLRSWQWSGADSRWLCLGRELRLEASLLVGPPAGNQPGCFRHGF